MKKIHLTFRFKKIENLYSTCSHHSLTNTACPAYPLPFSAYIILRPHFPHPHSLIYTYLHHFTCMDSLEQLPNNSDDICYFSICMFYTLWETMREYYQTTPYDICYFSMCMFKCWKLSFNGTLPNISFNFWYITNNHFHIYLSKSSFSPITFLQNSEN